jgi:hypothetical protein
MPRNLVKQPKIMKKPNEDNASYAFIDILRALTDTIYEKDKSPDELNRRTPDVDFILISSSRRKGTQRHRWAQFGHNPAF